MDNPSAARPPVPSRLGDYSVRPRILLIGALSLVVGGLAGGRLLVRRRPRR